ncbi:hypothetical protein DVR12_01195 [Chitinophaga silvatica]|uniref:Putative zinc-finger domain-containing protein n=1 Tax=Chitinophaga silvatica TaxID=2282649 RepID=A0A3E1YGA0_9BACT|nr:zf-HC2 domain-containing protein [Chitinophaga silvatica]RFS26433.1 hypothetical protein DVR12_01195 [Chitinophaga silvatica]
MLSNNKHKNDKVLKIFSSIRCLNKDQFPRYMDGRLTDIEKHLVEQHLADCDLCYNALLALEKEDDQDKYQDLTYKLQRFVRNSIQPVSHVQKVAQYTRKEKAKEHLLLYFWLLAFIGLGIGSVYVLEGHIRNQPPPVRYVAAVTPSREPSAAETSTPAPAATPPVVTPVNNTQPEVSTPNPIQLPDAPLATTTATTTTPGSVPVDSAAIKKAAALKAQQRKATADSLARIRRAQMLQNQQDSVRREAEKAKEAEKNKKEKEEEEKKSQKQENTTETNPEPAKKETPPPAALNSDEYLYKAAMGFQQQGNYGEAIDRYRKLESVSSGRYQEMARYQIAVCYRSKGQMGKARRMFREVVRMDGAMKNSAQLALDAM